MLYIREMNQTIKTSARYQVNRKYFNAFTYHGLSCMATVEDWCSEEITEITTSIAYQIVEI